MTSPAGAERAALCDLLDRLGPDAPTLCHGWTTYDLAAHLCVRDRSMLALPGYVLPSFAERTTRIERDFRVGHDYPDCVRTLREGAPAWAPLGLPVVREAANVLEYVVHHEDVRRARRDWQSRPVSTELLDAVWAKLRLLARLAFARVTVGVVLQRETGDWVRARRRPQLVTVVGDPVELAMYAYNRREVARVELRGDDDAKAALHLSRVGL
ncbi:MAG TPA: TIGR03085 family metal-binding protein [Mycobacteriales bacterium]|nr:TIGR03085 family metal-binding protein [Mycobacteriales bacterium]